MSDHPRLATWILTRCAPEYRGDSFIGDLVEQYQARGKWWYWRQALGAVRACSIRHLTATNGDVPAAEYVGDLVMAVALTLFAFDEAQFFADLFRSIRRIADITLIGALLLAAVIVAHLVRTRMAAARAVEPGLPHLH